MQNTKKHKFTQAEFDAFPVINGEKQCPTGDYTEIKHFGNRCSFGVGCSFGALCSFGAGCSFKKGCVCEFGEFSQMCRFERNSCTIYAFALTDGSIGIRHGTFASNLDEFRKEVQKTHGNSKLAKHYLAIADLVRLRFGKV